MTSILFFEQSPGLLEFQPYQYLHMYLRVCVSLDVNLSDKLFRKGNGFQNSNKIWRIQKSKLILSIEEIIREEITSKQDNYKSKR